MDWKHDLDCLFNPETIAFVGASNNIAKWGSIILGNIVSGGYRGTVHPINPREEWIHERQVYKTVSDIPGPVDLAMIVTPAKTVNTILEECAAKGIKAVIVVPGGFSEEGENGAALEKEIAETASKHEIRLIGPNTMGIYSSAKKLYALMAPVRPKGGDIAFVAQSGNLGTQLMSVGQDHEIGFSKFVASGNEAVLKCEDYLTYFGNDEDTKVVLAYIEGLEDGRRFLDVASEITAKKPLIVYKGGITDAGMKAASSHTGAMACSEEIFTAAFKQCGALHATNPKQMLDLAWALSELPLPRSNRIGILTWGGGWGVVTADCCEKAGMVVPSLSDATIKEIDKVLPPYWSKNNPIDLVGTLDRNSHLKVLETMMEDDNIDAAIVLGVVGGATLLTAHLEVLEGAPSAVTAYIEAYKEMDKKIEETILELIEKYQKPIIGVAVYESYRSFQTERGRMVVMPQPHMAVNVLDRMIDYKNYLETLKED